MRRMTRIDGYAPIADYGAIGDGRSAALVARDGSIDWLCLPEFDGEAVLGALLDAEDGGRFAIAPDEPFETARAYVADTNVLQTTMTCSAGAIRLTDAMVDGGSRALVRRIEGLAGEVPLAVVLDAHGLLGEPPATIRMGDDVLLAAPLGDTEPTAEALRVALAGAEADDRIWAAGRYDGPWRDEVVRSALALRLLTHRPTGRMVAAATTSLPEAIGGPRNWDYRYAWVRDSLFAVDALLALSCGAEAEAFMRWVMDTLEPHHPRIHPLYRLSGGLDVEERELDLHGYRGSRPVRVGNDAVGQFQLDVYGEVIQTAWQYARRRGPFDDATYDRLADLADEICVRWRQPDASIWEVRGDAQQFTYSKLQSWAGLERGIEFAEQGHIAEGRALPWRIERDGIRAFVEDECWSEEGGAWTRAAGSPDLDANLLLAGYIGYAEDGNPRFASTVRAIREELGEGALVRRYRCDDGLDGEEGAFLSCSFWLADALSRVEGPDAAAEVFEGALTYANDVGLFSEEADPATGEALGNTPQALVHLSLICAAQAIGR
jgi:GH15 family glucan-1,4-alpha-glucosidase